MQVVDAINDLMEESAGLSLCESWIKLRVLFLISDVIEQLSTRAVLHNQEEILWGFNNFVELD